MQKIASLQKWVGTITGLFIILTMFVIVIDALGRYFFKKPLLGALEITVLLLAWILFVPLGYGLLQDTHVRVTILINRLKGRALIIVEIIITLLGLAFFAFAIYAGWTGFWVSLMAGETTPAPIWIPQWLAKFAIPLGCALMIVQLFVRLISFGRQLGQQGGRS